MVIEYSPSDEYFCKPGCNGDIMSSGFTLLMRICVPDAAHSRRIISIYDIRERMRNHPDEINKLNDIGMSILYLAVIHGDLELVELLLNHGATIHDMKTKWNPIVGIVVMVNKDPELQLKMFLLLRKYIQFDGSTIIHDNKQTILMVFAKCMCVDKLFQYLSDDISAADFIGRTALYYAIEENNLVMVDYLLNQGHPIDYLDKVKMTPLMYAALYRSSAIVKLLISRGANMNAMTEYVLCIDKSKNITIRHNALWKISAFTIMLTYRPSNKQQIQNTIEIMHMLLDAGMDTMMDYTRAHDKLLHAICNFVDIDIYEDVILRLIDQVNIANDFKKLALNFLYWHTNPCVLSILLRYTNLDLVDCLYLAESYEFPVDIVVDAMLKRDMSSSIKFLVKLVKENKTDAVIIEKYMTKYIQQKLFKIELSAAVRNRALDVDSLTVGMINMAYSLPTKNQGCKQQILDEIREYWMHLCDE